MDLPPKSAVYHYSDLWQRDGTPNASMRRLSLLKGAYLKQSCIRTGADPIAICESCFDRQHGSGQSGGRMNFFRSAFAFAPALALAAPQAEASQTAFKVSFMNCMEFDGEGYVSLAIAQKLVPPGYTISKSPPGQAPIFVRLTSCASVQVNGAASLPTTISQIGVNVVSPDGTGAINNYMALYVSNNPQLVAASQKAGIPATLDPQIAYEYTPNNSGGGVLYGAVSPREFGPYSLYGEETDPPRDSAQPFIANWWYGANAELRQQTIFPAILFGASKVALYTSKTSPLGQLIGGNVYSSFTVLASRGVYATARMVVTVSARP